MSTKDVGWTSRYFFADAIVRVPHVEAGAIAANAVQTFGESSPLALLEKARVAYCSHVSRAVKLCSAGLDAVRKVDEGDSPNSAL